MTQCTRLQVDFVAAFLGVTLARAVAAPLNPNYTAVRLRPAATVWHAKAVQWRKAPTPRRGSQRATVYAEADRHSEHASRA